MALRGSRPRARTTAAIPTRFSDEELARIERVRGRLGVRSRSAFIREAVLEKVHSVETSKIIEIRDVSEKQAIRLIDQYLVKHPGVHDVDDIADRLGIELGVAFAAAHKLIERGRARVRGE